MDRQATASVIFLTLQSDSDWQLLAEVCQARQILSVVAVLAEPSVAAYLRALSSGPSVAAPRDASPEQLRQVFEHASTAWPCSRSM